MMSDMLRPATAALFLALAVLPACGGGSGDAKAAPKVLIHVTIVDSLPLGVYTNLDDVQCHAPGPDLISTGTPPNVTVSDGAGRILATQDAPAEGGVFEKGTGCTVPLTLPKVKQSDVYVVTVTGDDGSEKKTNVSRDGKTELTVDVDV